MISIITPILIGMLILTLLYVCYTDMTSRLIKNRTVIIVLLEAIAVGFFITHEFNYISPIIILVIGFILNYFGLVGAGDIKLLVALTVSLNSTLVLQLLLLMAFAGIPVALIAYIVHKLRRKEGRCEVPYGVAIVIGYFITLYVFMYNPVPVI